MEILLIPLVFFLILGLVRFSYASYGIYKSISANWWEKTEGLMENRGLVQSEEDFDSKYGFFSYKYNVDGQEYINDELRHGLSDTPNRIEWLYVTYVILRNHPKVNVYYNPENPSESMLVIGFPVFLIFQALLFLGIILLCGYFSFIMGVDALTKGST